ncbi:MAG: CRISPR-associated protein Cas5 [Firmicutes bacterium]|nr:CRISPR-associated protein Cas5 [Bacillota bacterium]
MNFSKVIEIDIWSKFGCFTKPDSTSGGFLTYLIPPKTSIIGIIGAILGYDFDEFEKKDESINKYKIEELYDIKISIQPLFDLKTKRVTFNRVSGTTEKTKIQNIHQDILINPYYKLFISFPDYLKDKEDLFLKRLENHETIYYLYMGRNEFPLSYEKCNVFDYESKIIDSGNSQQFFDNGEKIYGFIDRENISEVELKAIDKNALNDDTIIFQFKKNNEMKLKSFYEYIIPEYPIKRSNFTDFAYSEISFYTEDNFKDCYFSRLYLKNNSSVELVKFGDHEWILMI